MILFVWCYVLYYFRLGVSRYCNVQSSESFGCKFRLAFIENHGQVQFSVFVTQNYVNYRIRSSF